MINEPDNKINTLIEAVYQQSKLLQRAREVVTSAYRMSKMLSLPEPPSQQAVNVKEPVTLIDNIMSSASLTFNELDSILTILTHIKSFIGEEPEKELCCKA